MAKRYNHAKHVLIRRVKNKDSFVESIFATNSTWSEDTSSPMRFTGPKEASDYYNTNLARKNFNNTVYILGPNNGKYFAKTSEYMGKVVK